jgi:hypothetical protein
MPIADQRQASEFAAPDKKRVDTGPISKVDKANITIRVVIKEVVPLVLFTGGDQRSGDRADQEHSIGAAAVSSKPGEFTGQPPVDSEPEKFTRRHVRPIFYGELVQVWVKVKQAINGPLDRVLALRHTRVRE